MLITIFIIYCTEKKFEGKCPRHTYIRECYRTLYVRLTCMVRTLIQKSVASRSITIGGSRGGGISGTCPPPFLARLGRGP